MESDRLAAQTFVIDWTTVWTSVDEVRDAHRALAEACRRMAARGNDVRCLHSVFVASEGRWISFFTAQDRTVADTTADMAQIPQRVISAGVDVMALRGRGQDIW